MAKISTYATTPPALSDMLIGTDVNDMNSTKNFTIGSLLSLPGSTAYVPYTGALYNVDLGGNDITAYAFIVPGGLGTDFLKADGSLDNTVYLPLSTAASTYVPYTGATGNVDLGLYTLTANGLEITTDAVIMQGIQCFSGDYFNIGSNGWLASGFLVDFVNNRYFLGDWGNAVNGTYIHIDDANQEIEISQALKTSGNVGSSGDILVSQGAGSPPKWNTPNYLAPIYGSFYDTTTQTVTAGQVKAMELNTTDATCTNGFIIANNTLGRPTRITATVTGIYNLAFSAQLNKTGGGTAAQVDIWIRINETDVPYSNTGIVMRSNGDKVVAAWNFFLPLTAGQYVELMWTQADLINILAEVAGVNYPATPSVIATINRVS